MNPLLFAVVDQILRVRVDRARQTCGFNETAERRWNEKRRAVGAWRSLWPLEAP